MATNEKLKQLTQDYLPAAIEETKNLSPAEAVSFWGEIIQVANHYSLSIIGAVIKAQEAEPEIITPPTEIILP